MHRRTGSLVARSLLVVALTCAAAQSEPRVPDGFVLRPTFTTSAGEFEAGTAFVVAVDGFEHKVLLTALHLFGEAGGLDREIPAPELPRFARRVNVADAFSGRKLGAAKAIIPLPTAVSMNASPGAGDIAAFRVANDKHLYAASLAENNPEVGDAIWLAADVLNVDDQRLFKATVVEIEGPDLYFAYEDSSLELRATSGAPLLNSSGEVIGINLGAWEDEGIAYGLGNAVDNFRPHLVKALE